MSGELAKPAGPTVDEENGMVISIPDTLNPMKAASRFWVSSQPDTAEGKAALINVIAGTLPKLSGHINSVVWVTDVGRQSVTLTDKTTGEVFQSVRTILFLKSGDAIATISDGVSRSLGLIFSVWGPPPWRPALPLKIVQLELAEGRRLYQLLIDVPSLKGLKAAGK